MAIAHFDKFDALKNGLGKRAQYHAGIIRHLGEQARGREHDFVIITRQWGIPPGDNFYIFRAWEFDSLDMIDVASVSFIRGNTSSRGVRLFQKT